MTPTTLLLCPCGSTKHYQDCCLPLHHNNHPDRQHAVDACQLMRSRYCAYHQQHIDYLVQTTAPETRHLHDPVEIAQWAAQCEWLKLEIIDHQPGESISWVEFAAWHRQQGKLAVHHERSQFVRLEQRWFFHHGEYPEKALTVPGRNQPCFCGSAKKFKRCCGS